MSYEDLKKAIAKDCERVEAQYRAIRAKRAEKKAIKKGGGGHAIAKAIMSNSGISDDSTNFDYGYNTVEEQSPTETSTTSRCLGRVVCAVCKKFHGYCADVDDEKEKLKMLPTGDGSPSRSTKKGGLNWIRVTDLSTQPAEAKILLVKYTEEGQYGPQVMMKLAFKGEIRYMSVRPDKKKDARYAMMLDAWGPDENNWIDQRLLLSAEIDEFSEQAKMKTQIADKSAGRKRG